MKKNYLCSIFFVILLFSLLTFSKTNAQTTTAAPPPEAAVGTWQCARGSARMQGTQYMKGNYVDSPVVKWKAPVPSGCEGEPVIGDVNGDGKNDVVQATIDGHLVAFDGATGNLLWSVAGVGGMGSPVIGDANGDGKKDIAVAGSELYLIDGTNGNIIWAFSPPGYTGAIGNCVNEADLDGDGQIEVVFIVKDAVFAINGLNGTQKWKYATGNPATTANSSSPAIGDVNGDGILDVVADLENGKTGLNTGKLVALNGNTGTLIWSQTARSPSILATPVPAIGDLNGDCKNEVVFNSAAMKGEDGTILWGNPASFGSTWCIIADLKGDCNVEVVTGCGVLDGKTGNTIWTLNNCSLYGWFAPAPKVGDFDPNSPGKEILMGQSYQVQNGSVVANPLPLKMFNGYTGTLLWSLDIASDYFHTCEGISVGDVDNDGCVEIVVAPDCCGGDVSLLVLDDKGNSANCGILTSISQVNFLPADTVSCTCANFRDFSSGCVTSWNWTFPGGSPAASTIQNPGTICFADSGTYEVQMVASLNGCADTVVHPIFVSCTNIAAPVAHFLSGDSTLCTNDCIGFTDLSSNNPTGWLWTFQGGLPPTSTDQNPPFVCYPGAGTYEVSLVVTNSGGSDSLNTINFIRVIASPPPPGITQSHDTLFCSIDTSYNSYQWYDSTALVSGATGTFYVALHSGNFNIRVTNKSGCSTATGININLNPDGFNSFSADHSISIFPNPAHEELIIKGHLPGGNTSLTIFNTFGQIMQEQGIRLNDNIINIKGLSAGIYFITMQSEEGKWMGRFVKQ